ncbi:MAG: hypothetical protein RBT63_02330 [Bdellovibrionales bacterium]|jgi:ABC-type spermidine/putrescine transport system permease subunit II|nr:hypothetical protein [Bdellovibrionales bacterium]
MRQIDRSTPAYREGKASLPTVLEAILAGFAFIAFTFISLKSFGASVFVHPPQQAESRSLTSEQTETVYELIKATVSHETGYTLTSLE